MIIERKLGKYFVPESVNHILTNLSPVNQTSKLTPTKTNIEVSFTKQQLSKKILTAELAASNENSKVFFSVD